MGITCVKLKIEIGLIVRSTLVWLKRVFDVSSEVHVDAP